MELTTTAVRRKMATRNGGAFQMGECMDFFFPFLSLSDVGNLDCCNFYLREILLGILKTAHFSGSYKVSSKKSFLQWQQRRQLSLSHLYIDWSCSKDIFVQTLERCRRTEFIELMLPEFHISGLNENEHIQLDLSECQRIGSLCANLRTLVIDGNCEYFDCLSSVEPLVEWVKQCQYLEHLAIPRTFHGYPRFDCDDFLAKLVGYCPLLQSFRAFDTGLSCTGIEHLATGRDIIRLDVAECAWRADDLTALIPTKCPNLISLSATDGNGDSFRAGTVKQMVESCR